MAAAFHPVVSPSPLQNAFPHVPFMCNNHHHNDISDTFSSSIHSSPTLLLSKPEITLLQTAEESPLEYTLAEWEDAFCLVRVLLKLLDNVTEQHYSENNNSNSNNGMVHTLHLGQLNVSGKNHLLAESEARQVLVQDPTGAMTHYIISKLYDIVGLLVEKEQQQISSKSSSREALRVSILTLFFHPQQQQQQQQQQQNHSNSPCLRIVEDWRPLWRILQHQSESDDFTKRGAALILAYLVKTGCSQQQQSRRKRSGDALLLLPPLEHNSNHIHPSASTTSNNATVTGVEEILQSLVSWITSQLQSSHNTSLGVVTPALMILATTTPARRAFDQAGGIGYLSRHIKQFHLNHQRHKQMRQRNSRQMKNPSYNRSISSPDRSSNRFGVAVHKKSDDYALVPTISLPSVSDSVTKVAEHLRIKNHSITARARRSISSTNGSSHHNNLFYFSHSTPSPAASSTPLPTSPTGSLVSQMASMVLETAPATLTSMVEAAASSVLETKEHPTTSSQESPSRAALRHSNGYSPHHHSPSSLYNGANNNLFQSPCTSVQQLYELVFALWCISLDCYLNINDDMDDAAARQVRQHFARDGAIPALVQLLQTAPREKVLRLAVASLRILATLDDNHSICSQQISLATNNHSATSTSTTPSIGSAAYFVREMIACNILKALDFLQQRQWNDPDLQDDLDVLMDVIQHHSRELTQWKVYQAEVDTGVLRWDSHFHNSKFFQQNALSMEGPQGDFAPLTKLVQILYRQTKLGQTSSSYYVGLKQVTDDSNTLWDEDVVLDDEVCQTLAVALYDIGEFARHYPNGRAVIAAASRQRSILGRTKDLVMQYMQFPREEVQEQALFCASKLLVKNWRKIEDHGAQT